MKRGFTLVELLGTLVILSLLILIVFSSVTGIIKSSKNTVYRTQINSILAGTHDYTLKYPSELPKNKGDKKYISLLKLQKMGYVDNLINPKNKETFPLDLVISIEYTGGNYQYNNKNSKLYGSYLYTVLTTDVNKSNNMLLKPNITIEGLPLQADGTYYYNFDVGNTYESFSPTVRDGVEIITIILDDEYDKGGNEVDTIDPSKKGIYYKYFIAVDPNGNSNYVVEHIVITDDEIPTLVVQPDTVELERNAEYDLMTGVSCTDNSGNCTITTTGTVDFTVSGSYSITYVGKDPSGNSVSKKRTIRVN